jgi:surfeit locus 1 family protein
VRIVRSSQGSADSVRACSPGEATTGPAGLAGTLPTMRSDLLRPRALLGHLLVLTVAAACVALGLWQLDRLGQVRDHNARLAERMEADPVDLGALATAGEVDGDPLEFRRVEVTGTFRPEEEVLQRGQQDPRGQQGFHLLTPLDLGDGTTVLVRRGWVPTGLDTPPVTEAAPPAGEVTIRGLLERAVPQPGFGPQDPPDGQLARVFHPDTDRLDRQVTGDLLPVVVRFEEGPSTDGEFPVLLERPVLDEANHRSYAVQWFTFAALALVTYGAWLARRPRRPDDHPPVEGPRAPTRPGALT